MESRNTGIHAEFEKERKQVEMIRVENLVKTFRTAEEKVHAVHDISFSVQEGEIFGVIGLSGAGKSTLVRCLNRLERPDTGRIFIGDREITAMNERELMMERRKIGMIFQSYNLLMQQSVLDNVCFPLEIAGVHKKEAREKAMEYLETVGLAGKAKAYPAQLSGGQKQRVAIARTLASSPEIILCDEATNALDPETTGNILSLLKKINEEMGITIVIITHEMRVIEEICHRVAVLENGTIAEMGDVKDIMTAPQTRAAKRLILSRQNEKILADLA